MISKRKLEENAISNEEATKKPKSVGNVINRSLKIETPENEEYDGGPGMARELWWTIFSCCSTHDLINMIKVNRYFYYTTLYYLENVAATFNVIGSFLPSDEQEEVLNDIVFGKSIYLGGEAGAGKSATMMMIQMILDRKKIPYSVCASTAQAASGLGGKTFHSLFGLGDKNSHLTPESLRTAHEKQKLPVFPSDINVVIMDEISMIGARLFELVSEMLKLTRKCNKPFGGLQMVLVGDFLQLPPIDNTFQTTPSSSSSSSSSNDRNWKQVSKVVSDKFAFETETWKEMFEKETSEGKVFYLTRNFRQANADEPFKKLLSSLRYGSINDQTESTLASRVYSESTIDQMCRKGEINPIKILPTNKQVELENEKMFNMLKTPIATYHAVPDGDVKAFSSKLIPQDEVKLRVGTKVLVTKNHINRETGDYYYNGRTGIVIGFAPNQRSVIPNPEFNVLPIVEFNDEPGIEHIIYPVVWEVKERNKQKKLVVVATKTQLPLIRGWGITIHKSQGMTLKQIVVDLRRIWEHGQGYVAISRCTTLEGLFLLGYDKTKITASPVACNFYFKIMRQQQQKRKLLKSA